ncbi:ABC transporter substrate-binding protein [Magnetococcus sp. PR-3]|uniref:ABC transporter substrate-binding protein n=1 Tax=Magnetococcus sp. PR-3 TaxID=3120355 RepID=UPI002FCE1EFC
MERLLPLIIAGLFLLPATSALALDRVSLQLRWDHQFQFAGYYAAHWMGFYKDAGLDVDIRSAFQTSAPLLKPTKEVAEQRADFGVGAADILVAADQGSQLVVTASIFQQSPTAIFLRPGLKISHPKQLEGLNIRHFTGDIPHVELGALLRKYGANFSKLPPSLDRRDNLNSKMLFAGNIDAFPGYLFSVLWEAKQQGQAIEQLHPANFGIHFMGDSIFTSRKMLENDRDKVTRFVTASLKGWRYALDHPREIALRISQMSRTHPLTDREGFNLFLADQVRRLTHYPVIPLGQLNNERWAQMHQQLKDSGLVKGTFDPTLFLFDPQQEEIQRQQGLIYLISSGSLLLLAIILSVVFWNRTLRNRVELRTEQLSSSEARYRTLFETIEVGVAVYKPIQDGADFIFHDLNRHGEQVCQTSREALMGQRVTQVFPSIKEMGLFELFQQVHQDGKSRVLPTTLYDDKKITLWVENRVFALPNGEIIAVYADQTERRNQEQQLKLTLEELQQANDKLRAHQREVERLNTELENRINDEVEKNRQKDVLMMHQARLAAMGEMMGNIAHQWRQPISALGLMIHNLRDQHADNELTEEIMNDKCNQVMGLVKNMSRTIDDFRNFFKPDRVMEPFDLPDATAQAIELVRSAMNHHEICVELTDSEPLQVMGYTREFCQVVLVVLSNAKDAILDHAQRQEKGWIGLSIHTQDAWAELRIKDNGGGIEAAILEKIFDPYFTTKDDNRGTGIGLYMGRMIITEHMNGQIEARNGPQGAEFILRLPLA